MSESPIAFISCALVISVPLALWFWSNPKHASQRKRKDSSPGTFPADAIGQPPIKPSPIPLGARASSASKRKNNKKKKKNTPASTAAVAPSPSSSSQIDALPPQPALSSSASDSEDQSVVDDGLNASVDFQAIDSESDWIAVNPNVRKKKSTKKMAAQNDMNPWAVLTPSPPHSSSSSSSISSTVHVHSYRFSSSPPDVDKVRVLSLVGSGATPTSSAPKRTPPSDPDDLSSHSYSKSQRKHLKRRTLIKSQIQANNIVQQKRLMLHRLDQQLMNAHQKNRPPPPASSISKQAQPTWTFADGVPLVKKDKVAQSFLWSSAKGNDSSVASDSE